MTAREPRLPTPDDRCACDSYREAMRLTRRGFLGAAGALSLPFVLPRAVFSVTPVAGDVLVVVFLRGGADGLNFVVPLGDSWYRIHRSQLAVAESGPPGEAAIALDSFFGLHPAAAAMKSLWDGGQLAIVHATGLPNGSHSHFDAMSFLERADPGGHALTTGWIGRHLALSAPGTGSALRAVGVGNLAQLALRGEVGVAAIEDVAAFRLKGDREPGDRFATALGGFYADPTWLSAQARLTLESVQRLADESLGTYIPSGGAVYPEVEVGRGLKLVARLLKADLGMEAACVDYGGWDTHAQQGLLTGDFPFLVGTLAASLRAFVTDLGPRAQRVTVVVMSEFGRRPRENASSGTDHGYGNCCFVLGGGIIGRRVYGAWPGLDPHLLDPVAGDLAVTTDLRSVLAEIVERRLGNPAVASVFPGLGAAPYLGFARPL